MGYILIMVYTNTATVTIMACYGHFNKKVEELNSFYGPKHPLLVKCLGHASATYCPHCHSFV
jgi:hypothetical protein